jgi:RNA polymerase sigma-70 factor (ECF subfamily)
VQLKEFENNILPLKDKLFRIAFRIIRNGDDAADVVQDVMLKMWQMRNEWNTITNKEAYCCMMSRNFALSHLKLKDNQNISIEGHDFYETENNSPYKEVEREENMRLLSMFLEKLPSKEREVVELRDIEHMSYKEIESVLNINEGQVKITLFRARQKIKEYFNRIN